MKIDPSILQWGALGLGLAILVFTGDLLRRELAKSKPRPEGRNLILMFMTFSVVLFGFAIYLELQKSNFELQRTNSATLNEIAQHVSEIDANMGDKYTRVVEDVRDDALQRRILDFEVSACKEVKAIFVVLARPGAAQCRDELPGSLQHG